MGIRYYAYAFDNDQTDQALANPRAFISSDPLADAWGMKPHASVSVATFKQVTPERDLLYLDKAWPFLQDMCGPVAGVRLARPSFRMFEGSVTMRGEGWIPWCRALGPDEVARIADDLGLLERDIAEKRPLGIGISSDEVGYELHFLARARTFVERLAAEGRGLAYMIG